MKIEIDIPAKLEQPLETVVKQLQKINKGQEVTPEKILSFACKQFIRLEHDKYLNEDEVPDDDDEAVDDNN